MKSYLWIICVAALGIGCGHAGIRYYTRADFGSEVVGRVIRIQVDGDFGEADKMSIDEAVDQWNYVLNGYIVLKVYNWNYVRGSEKIEPGEFLIIKIGEPYMKDNKLAYADRIGGNVIFVLRDKLNNEDISYLMLHEIGHLLGAGHLGERLMSTGYEQERYKCVDYLTMKQVADKWNLPIDKLNYCY